MKSFIMTNTEGDFVMQYIKNEDYDYIMHKYADEPKSIVGRNRFVRQDKIFNENTGLDGDVIIQRITEEDVKMSDLSHPIRKAKALEFVLKNTRISCDGRDIFPAINSLDRPLNQTIIGKWNKELFREKLPYVLGNGAKQALKIKFSRKKEK